MDQTEKIQRSMKAAQAFTPGVPIDEKDLFAGRIPIVKRVVGILGQRGQHAIIFGERGVGKTSFARVLTSFLAPTMPIIAPHIDCETTDTVSSIWRKVFSQVEVSKDKDVPGFNSKHSEERFSLSETFGNTITSDQVQENLERLVDGNNLVIVILDEFDRIQNDDVRRSIADTIKSMSDHGARSTLIIVGVADAVTDLIAQHESVERNLIQIQMPRMSASELEDIVRKAIPQLGMEIDPVALSQISFFSRGFPYYTHKLGMYCAHAAIEADSLRISADHVSEGIDKTVNDGQYTHLKTYVTATRSPRKRHLFREVLLACALTPTDELGYFSASDVRLPLSTIMGKPYDVPSFARHLKEFCDPKRGKILEQTGGPYSVRYRFSNPMMQPFVAMKGFSDKMWTPELPEKIDDNEDIKS
jgi:Cdc6-like AAA superfamily ATPase